MIISEAELQSFTGVIQSHPHDFLGMHRAVVDGKSGIVVRAYLRDAKNVSVKNVKTGRKTAMTRLSEDGFFEAWFPRNKEIFAYRFVVENYAGEVSEVADGYSFWPTISESDLYLITRLLH